MGERQFGRHSRRQFWVMVIASQKLSRDSGETIFAARHQDVSQGPLGLYFLLVAFFFPPPPRAHLHVLAHSTWNSGVKRQVKERQPTQNRGVPVTVLRRYGFVHSQDIREITDPNAFKTKAQMHLSRNRPSSDKTNLHLELPGKQKKKHPPK